MAVEQLLGEAEGRWGQTVSQASVKKVQGVGGGKGYAEKGGKKIPRVRARRSCDFKERGPGQPGWGDDIA